MNRTKIVGIIIAIIGVICLLFSNYIAERVATGRMQIAQGQKSVNTIDNVFSQNQYTKPFGKVVTGSAQKKINAGTAEANQYADLSNQLRVGGVILIIIGAGIFFIGGRKRG